MAEPNRYTRGLEIGEIGPWVGNWVGTIIGLIIVGLAIIHSI